MELVCEKYKEKVAAENARCRRPTEYCKFRTACMIHFLSREKGAGRSGEDNEQRSSGDSREKE